jgi:CRISPR-associated protein Cmr6
MVFAKAFRDANAKKGEKVDMPDPVPVAEAYPERVPMMYRAQVRGRCSLQFAGDKQDLQYWTEEWVYPNHKGQPTYQRSLLPEGLEGSIYRFKLKFPFRVCSNCGQDTIIRPLIGKNGIPFIPGSGVKGLFERLSRSHPDPELRAKIREYCGSPDHPGKLRFHGAYPIGDWAGTNNVTVKRTGESISETRYRMVDVVHPQQTRQVKGTGNPTALALVTLHQPTLMFELSSPKPLPENDWETIKGLLRRALRQGLGGKTSTGYGLWTLPKDNYALKIDLKGVGVSSLLRSDEPEFRPNMFKASLRSHMSRLLAGVCDDPIGKIEPQINRFFGDTRAPGVAELYWESKPNTHSEANQGKEQTPTYKLVGTLYADICQRKTNTSLSTTEREKEQKDLQFFRSLIQFAYVMGGFGKSWRRVWHKSSQSSWHPGFYPTYETRAIGCHWEWLDSSFDQDFDPTQLNNCNALKTFLDRVHEQARTYLGLKEAKFCDWKEAWHPKRVAVYSQVVSQSQAIELFHDKIFKTTLAIGGKTPNDTRPTHISSIWHRMLPIENNHYLEIVTVFHANRVPWKREGIDQFDFFIERLENNGLVRTWGSDLTTK